MYSASQWTIAIFLLPDNNFSPECMPIASQLYRFCCGYSGFTVVDMVASTYYS